MQDKTIVIIGAGFAGLAAGIYARMNGYRSQIFEMHTLPGGIQSGRRLRQALCKEDRRRVTTRTD